MSERTLRRRLLDYGLRRKMQPSSLLDVWNAVRLELHGPGTSFFVCFLLLPAVHLNNSVVIS